MESVRNTFYIFKREFKAYFESPMAYVFIVVFLLLTGFITFYVEMYFERSQADLRPFFLWHPWVYLLLVPAAAMRLWAEEHRSGTIELLLTLPVTLTQAILGKFLAAWLFLGIALALTFPIVLTTTFMLDGDLDHGPVIGAYLGSFMVAGTYLSVGMLTSALTRNQVISFVVALAACFVLAVASYAPFLALFVKAPPWLLKGVASFGVIPHYDWIRRGVLDIRDFGYYISVMVVMLFATHLALQNRKSP